MDRRIGATAPRGVWCGAVLLRGGGRGPRLGRRDRATSEPVGLGRVWSGSSAQQQRARAAPGARRRTFGPSARALRPRHRVGTHARSFVRSLVVRAARARFVLSLSLSRLPSGGVGAARRRRARQVLALFSYFDSDHSGTIAYEEFAKHAMLPNPLGGTAVNPKVITMTRERNAFHQSPM